MTVYDLVSRATGFQWDEGNSEKNRIKHNVTNAECEQAFFNQPLVLATDEKHSSAENRYYSLGRTDVWRRLFIVFTVRGGLIRIISARDMSSKERALYDHQTR